MSRASLTRSLALAIALVFAGSTLPLSADDPKVAKATPPPKKKAEREADEEEAPEPDGETTTTEETFSINQVLLGTWTTEGGARLLVIKAGGAYTLTGSRPESGHLTAMFGRYLRRLAKTKQWNEGTFKFRTIDQMETDGPLGKATWARVK